MSSTHLFAQRNQAIKPSAIRQIFALLKRPGIISFAGGWPAPDLFPVQAIEEVTQHVLRTESADALQYGGTGGDPRLRDWLASRMNERWGTAVTINDIMITSGAQQGIYLTSSLLLDPGDALVVEAPTFVGAFGAFQTFQGRMIGARMDADGLDMDALEALLQRERVKFVYTIPDFQNPSGLTMTLARRERLVALAAQYDCLILEDSPYSDLRYGGEALPPIYALDPNGRTIHLGSFSKTLTPLRVGWLIAPAPIVAQMTVSKMANDVCTPALTQAIIYHFAARGLLDSHIVTLRAAYQHKRDVMLAALDRYMPAGIEWTTPDGGMFIWLTLPQQIDATALFHKALEQDVAFVVGSAFYPDALSAPTNELRLNFITPNESQITSGIERLAQSISQSTGA